MADMSQGEGWWEASDHKWYPPRLHADAAHRAAYARQPPPPAPIEAPAQPTTGPEGDSHAEAATRSPAAATPAGQDDDRDVFGADRRPWRAKAALGVLAIAVLVGGALWFTRDNEAGDDLSTDASLKNGANSEASRALPVEAEPRPPDEVGSAEKPAAFGQMYDWGDWRAGVVEVLDAAAEGLIAEFGDEPADGRTFLAVIYEVAYTGPDLTGYEPMLVSAVGSDTYESFGCFLDSAALAERNIQVLEFELVAGQTISLAECFDVPDDEVADLVFTLENFEEFDGAVVFSADGADLADPAPITASPDYTELPLQPFGEITEWEEWSAAVTAVTDAEEDKLVSRFSDPPRPGYSYQVISYDVTYSGDEPTGYLQVYPTALGSAVFSSSTCVLDTDALEAAGFNVAYEFAPGQTAPVAECVEVPDDEVGELVIRLESFAAISDTAAYYRQ